MKVAAHTTERVRRRRIDANRPLFSWSAADLAARGAGLFVRLVGFDEPIAQDVQVRHSDIQWGYPFEVVLRTDLADGTVHIDYLKFHHNNPLAARV